MGARGTPGGPAILEFLQRSEAGGGPVAGGAEGERGGKIEGDDDHEREDDAGSGQVEDVDHAVGEESAGSAFDGQGVTPKGMSGRQKGDHADGGRAEDDPETETDAAGGGVTCRAGSGASSRRCAR